MGSAYSISFLIGIILVAVANLGFRSAEAPGLGSGAWEISNKRLPPTIALVMHCAGAQTAPNTLAAEPIVSQVLEWRIF